jgi:hypothetical protein
MKPEQFKLICTPAIAWINQILITNDKAKQNVSSGNFLRLPHYFPKNFLDSAQFIVVDKIPVPPLTAMGLKQFSDFENGDYAGITYKNTFFVRRDYARNEKIFFHELIHVVQWQILGPERFLDEYVLGLETSGYMNSPLEKMAYEAAAIFEQSTIPFNAAQRTIEQLRLAKIIE